MKDWKSWLVIGLILVVAVLLYRSCTAPSVSTNTRRIDSAFSVIESKDSIIARKDRLLDSVNFTQIGVSALLAQLTNKSLINEKQISILTNLIRTAGKDSVFATIREEGCDSLVVFADRQVRLNEDLRTTQSQKDSTYGASITVRDTTIQQLLRSYVSMENAANIARETAEQWKPRNQVYMGISGLYNPLTYGIGGTVMFKTKRDRMYGATIYTTNSKLAYEARALIKINLRR